ncbi:MAG TPA: ankyrin repeat domain-containing protein [Candidatus Acidoferrales bacterium]|nr:ankyrin repeat domain-containing protein [Candidatus Acidoferrales bacterium]
MLGAQKFLEAVKSGDLARVKQMLTIESGLANARAETGPSAVLLAVYHGRTEIRDALIASGAKLDIHEATAAGKSERVAALVRENPAAINSFAADGFAPLALAGFFGHRDLAEWLLDQGAEVNAVSKNPTGYTALSGAVARGDAEIVRMLLSHGANARHRYGQGYSPLHEAAASGKLEIVKLLLAHGADANAATDDGHTPLTMAEAKGQAEAAALLRAHGAKAKAEGTSS